jgi:hypothetical protein
MAKTLSRHATTAAIAETGIVVTYHHTVIVRTDPHARTITLDLGGWDTVTTRAKMNQAAAQFDLGFSVFRKDGITYARTRYGDRHTDVRMNLDSPFAFEAAADVKLSLEQHATLGFAV